MQEGKSVAVPISSRFPGHADTRKKWRIDSATVLYVFLIGMTLLFCLPAIAGIAVATDQTLPVELNAVSAPSHTRQTGEQLTSPVVVDGRTLFRLRGVSAYSAASRTSELASKIVKAAEDESLSTDKLTVVENEDNHIIRIGAEHLMEVVDADARFEDVKRAVLAEAKLAAIKQSIDDYRRDRTTEVLLNNALYASLATALFVALIAGMRWLGRALRRTFEKRYTSQLEEMEEKSHRVFKLEQLWGLISFVQRVAAVLIVAVAVYVYINSVLSLFPWTRSIGRRLLEYLVTPLRALGNGLLDFLPDLFFLLILFFIVRFLLGMVQGLFSALARERIRFKGFDAEWSWPTYQIVRILVLAFSLVIAYPYLPGSESAAFKATTLFIGVIFSIGSSSVITNIVAGYMLTYRRAFKLGDIIKVGDVIGEVIEARVPSTHLRTWKNEEIVLPNSVIVNGQVTNFSSRAKREGLVLHTTVGIGYEVPWRQVEAMLLIAARKTIGIATNREPFVRQKSLGDFGVVYEINVFCDTPKDMSAMYTKLHRNIQDVFNEYQVAIMTPAYVADPAEPKYVPKEKWYELPAETPGN